MAPKTLCLKDEDVSNDQQLLSSSSYEYLLFNIYLMSA